MPQFISNNGEWEPADLAAKAELKARGIKTLGVKVTKAANPQHPVAAVTPTEPPKAVAGDKFPEIKKLDAKGKEVKPKEVKPKEEKNA